MEGDESTELLREVVRLLRVIARPQMTELRERFASSMLSSPARRKMWQHMDGTRSLKDIATKAGTSAEAVRLFLVDIEGRWPELIESNRTSAGRFPRRLG